MSKYCPCHVTASIPNCRRRNDRSMDGLNTSGKRLECVSGGDDDRSLRRRLNDDNDADNIVREGASLESVSKSKSLKRKIKATHPSTKLTQPLKMQWPKWPVSHMLRLSNMEKVMNYYRVLNLGKDMDDKDLRCFLEEQLGKEKAGLSEMTITNRLRTKPHASAAAEEPDSCSICMGEYKEQDEIASLYYCSHQYHAECIKEWLPKNNLCPMCRALAIIPEEYPSWDGDVRLHQAFFVHLKYAAP